MASEELIFKALADPTRRALLDRLHERNGQTLSELCDGLAMARQSVTQHLDLLEDANLIATIRRGRQRLHYINPVPLHELQARWIDKLEQPRLRMLRSVKRKAELMNDRPTFVYVIYIESNPEAVWDALTDADTTAAYWGHSNVSDWKVGSHWEHQRTDGSQIADTGGTVIESNRPTRLVTTWEADPTAQEPVTSSTVTFLIEPHGDIVRLTVTHENLPDEANREIAARGWAAVLSNLKSLLETGHVLPNTPWEMP